LKIDLSDEFYLEVPYKRHCTQQSSCRTQQQLHAAPCHDFSHGCIGDSCTTLIQLSALFAQVTEENKIRSTRRRSRSPWKKQEGQQKDRHYKGLHTHTQTKNTKRYGEKQWDHRMDWCDYSRLLWWVSGVTCL